MNLYSLNTIKQEFSFLNLNYTVQFENYSETLELIYRDKDNKEMKELICAEVPILTNWMEILDYDTEEKESLENTFELLTSTLDMLYLSTKDATMELLNQINPNSFVDLSSSVLDTIKECFDPHPALTYLYPHYYKLLSILYNYNEQKLSADEAIELYAQNGTLLKVEISGLKKKYEEAREYAQNVLIAPYQEDASISTYNSASLYQSYCKATNHFNFYDTYFDYPLKVANTSSLDWNTFHQQITETQFTAKGKTYSITSFEQMLHIGLSIMLENGTIIRKCKLCNGYFNTKHTSDQMFCNRIYKNTAGTCSEAGIRKTYKEKLFKHPIHQEFTKSYNKLYGRIRRGKLPADTPLMDQLKKLHDEYTEKYENTHHKDREEIWKEYIQKNKDLLG